MAVRIGIDVGGTFTDVTGVDEDKGDIVLVRKYDSSPADPMAVMDAITRDLHAEFGPDGVSLILHGSTAAPRLLAFSGSARRESLNRKFLAVAVQAARDAGGEVTLLDLNDYVLPLYHGDLEDAEGLPANATKLTELITRHDALLIASPEYNSMITPLLKNTIDWCTRGDDNPFTGKVAAVISASPGPFGGVRSLKLAQQLLLHLGCHVVPGQTALIHADKAFDATGGLTDARAEKSLRALVAALVATTKRFSS